MSIAVDALTRERNKLLHELEEYDRPDVRRLQDKARDARKALADAEGLERTARDKAAAKEAQVAELNAAIHRLNGTRPITDRPQA
jgi:predicted  nucleic acid-binding Zn-ribbon protein